MNDPHTLLYSESALLGRIPYTADKVLHFIEPLLGLESLRDFLLLRQATPGHFWLQSLDQAHALLYCVDPFAVGIDYDLEIGYEDAAIIDAQQDDDIQVLTTVAIDYEQQIMRTNLRAPVLANKRSRLASQVVHIDESLPLQYYFGSLSTLTQDLAQEHVDALTAASH